MSLGKSRSAFGICLVFGILAASSFLTLPLHASSPSTVVLSQGASPSSNISSDPVIEYPIPTHNAGPNAVVTGPNKTLWFVEFAAGKIGEFFIQNASFREFVIPESGAQPACLAIDSFGNIWFSDQHGSGSIWMLDPQTGSFRQFPTNTHGSTPLFILFDSEHNVWFTEITGDKIGELSFPSYNQSEYALPEASSGPVEMAYQENTSTLWITQTYSGQLASFNMISHSFTEYNPTVSMNSPVGIVLDRQGNVWISEHRGSSIIEFSPASSTWRKFVTSVPPPDSGYDVSAPATLAIASNGDLWFVEHFSNQIGRLDPSTGALEQFAIPNSDAYSVLNAIDSSGNFWFTQYAADAIGFVSANASSPLSTRLTGQRAALPTVNAGKRISLNITITNTAPTVLGIQLNASSSFSSTGYIPASEAGFVQNKIALDNGSTTVVSLVVAPPITLASGVYSVGAIFTTGNYSVVQNIFVRVLGDPYLWLPSIQNYLEIVLGGAVVALGGFYYFGVRTRPKKPGPES